jgi:hypothetical protein
MIWADAICINQDDIDERNQQVKQMGLVYQQANHTMIYLGEGTSETRAFLERLQSKSTIDHFASLSINVNLAGDTLDVEVEEAARAWILSRPWFKRVWILQELVLSQDPWIQCGLYSARWSSFNSHISETAKKRSLKQTEETAQNMGSLRLQYRRHERPKDLPPFARRLYDLLKSRKGFGVTDPRDMLFANLGLIDRAIEDEDTLFNLIVVDYEKTEEQVYRDLAYYLFENLQDFRIFSLCDSSERHSNRQMPSWAPDWATAPPSGYSRISDVLEYRQPKGNSLGHFWSPESRVLFCGAKYLGEVQELTAIIDQSLSPQIAKKFSELLQKGLVLRKDLFEFIKSAFTETYHEWQHLLGESIPDPARMLEALENRNDDEFFWLWQGVLIQGNPEQEHLIVGDIIRTMISVMNPEKDPKADLRLHCEQPRPWGMRCQSLLAQLVFSSFATDGPNLFHSRRIATLVDDSIALVPGATKIGDTISIPINDRCPVPLVLRTCLTAINTDVDVEFNQQKDDWQRTRLGTITRPVEHFTIIGECFVQEWMHGETPDRYLEAPDEMARNHLLALH